MRLSWLSIVVLAAAAGVAQAEHRSAGERAGAEAGSPAPEPLSSEEQAPSADRTLSLAEIHAKLKPVSAEIGRCYRDAAAGARGGGKLLVQLDIHRRGKLDAVTVQTPGLPAKVARKIDACVRELVEPLEFPARRAPTTAVLPYYFQRTDAPAAGPRPSCWSPRGCPGR